MKNFLFLPLLVLAFVFSVSAQLRMDEKSISYAIAVQTSGGVREWLGPVINFSNSIVTNSCKNDEGMLLRFVGRDRIEIEQPFTTNHDDLKDAIDNLYIEGGQTAIIDAVYLTLENMTEHFELSKNKPNSQVLILISNGVDSNSYYNEKQLLELAKESKVTIYAIGIISPQTKEAQAKSRKFLERLSSAYAGKAFFPNSVEDWPVMVGRSLTLK